MDYLPLCRNEEAFFFASSQLLCETAQLWTWSAFFPFALRANFVWPSSSAFSDWCSTNDVKILAIFLRHMFYSTFKFAIMWRERATSKQAEWENDLRSTDDAQENTSVCAWMLSYAKRYYLRKIYAKNKVSRHKKVAAWTVRDFRNSNLCNAWFMDVKRRGGRARLQWRVPVFRVAA